MSLIDEIRTFVEANLPNGETTGVYAFQRPPNVDSIVVKPDTSQQANVLMWSQQQFFTIEVVKKISPKASYDLSLSIRDTLLSANGVLVNGGQKILKIYAENTTPEVVDINQNENEVYGITYRIKYLDNTIPVLS